MTIEWSVHTYASLPSTQDYVKELAQEGLPEGLVIQAIEQRAGKGRHGRHWFSPMGNLYMSVLLRPGCDVAQAGQLAFVTAVALSVAMDEVVDKNNHQKALKWPNDILIDGKKVSGILIEKEGDAYVVGVGVNIMNPPDDAVGLNQVTWEINVPIHPFRDKFLNHLGLFYAQWQKDGFAPIRRRWLAEAFRLNEEITVSTPPPGQSGIFRDLDEHGCLVLEQKNGKKLAINSGEVYFGALNNIGA